MTIPTAIARLTLILALAVVTAGCGMFGKKDPERDPMKLADIDATLAVDRMWKTSVGAGLGKAAPGLKPFFADGLVWAADHKGRVFAIDARSGDRVRRFDTERDQVQEPILDPLLRLLLDHEVGRRHVGDLLVVVPRHLAGAVEPRVDHQPERAQFDPLATGSDALGAGKID